MLKDSLRGHIQFKDKADCWKDAIADAAQPLLEQGYIQESYKDAMIGNVEKYGSYIVVAPQIAMPHSKSEDGVLKTGVALLKLEQAVMFPGNLEVKALMVLAANDADTHLELISEFTDILMDDDKVEKLLTSSKKEELLEILI